ncbi:GyrI-like domain-containing protein [Microbacterium sp. Au-Mic1]|uniref:GyrI-like domain-containing protein n=1 Tax=Microbacterium sp. Au-Mic1 TaxID=2906457 RepID=UPI001E4FC8B6|nr:GyrI-like domain-containing protein [Microbacterium sp. Au-Mic1]MCE4024398.1 GyrI-like domain-containing protein [Microbacterium sp. Au-Mic1]
MTTGTKTDLAKSLDGYRARTGEFRLVDLPASRYLAIDGHGDPNTAPAYAEALETLYPVAYALKFASRRELDRDYVVPPLEGLWWADEMDAFTTARDKSRWDWTMLILIPEWIQGALVDDSIAAVRAKKAPARLDDLRVLPLSEGLCMQTLHIGTFDDEAPLLERMHDEIIPEQGLRLAGLHHEVYLSDARRVAPEKRRTILRQPVAPA